MRRIWLIMASTLGGIGIAFVVAFHALDHAFPPDLTRAALLSQQVLDSSGRPLRVYLTAGGFLRLPASIERVDRRYLDMLIAYEDKRFYEHGGVDPLAVGRAVWQVLSHGRVVSGASTLTMQTARLLEPRARSLASKLIEMFRALQLEQRYSKKEILSLYLTLAPFGGNREGVDAAARAYFGHSPEHLDVAEAALLVALPQSPSQFRPDRYPAAARAARNKVLRRLAAADVISHRAAWRAMTERISVVDPSLPRAAAHLADRLTRDYAAHTVIETTIDGTLQHALERLARNRAHQLGRRTDVAILVVENASRRVRTYVGSADFDDDRRLGQIDMVRAIRSPGSALKPIIYGLAFDRGLIHPATIIDDVPMRFGGYAPTNFDNRYHGEVTIADALRLSLNVPAVAVLARLGPVSAVERLRRAGVTLEFGGDDVRPGLAFALGGVGTTLEDLVALYAALADDGRVRPLGFTTAQTEGAQYLQRDNTLLGEAARRYVSEILRGVPLPDLVLPDSLRARPRHIAFKTGTSYGHRDAWTVGYTARFTVGVWVGRADGTPNPGRSGANTAAPLLFSVFDHLPPPSPQQVAQRVSATTDVQFLPPVLRRFERTAGGAVEGRHAVGPRIVAPVDQAILPLPPGGRPLVIEVAGGTRPLRWVINETAIMTRGAARRVQWRPDGPGFADIVVIDARGRRAGIHIRLVDDLPTSATILQKVAITDPRHRAAAASTGIPEDPSGR